MLGRLPPIARTAIASLQSHGGTQLIFAVFSTCKTAKSLHSDAGPLQYVREDRSRTPRLSDFIYDQPQNFKCRPPGRSVEVAARIGFVSHFLPEPFSCGSPSRRSGFVSSNWRTAPHAAFAIPSPLQVEVGLVRILPSPLPPVIYSGNWVRLVKFQPTVQRFPNTPGHLEDGFVSHLLPGPCPQPNAPKIGFVPSNHYGLLRPFLGIGFVPSTSHGSATAPSGIGFVPQTFRTPAANPNPLPSC